MLATLNREIREIHVSRKFHVIRYATEFQTAKQMSEGNAIKATAPVLP